MKMRQFEYPEELRVFYQQTVDLVRAFAKTFDPHAAWSQSTNEVFEKIADQMDSLFEAGVRKGYEQALDKWLEVEFCWECHSRWVAVRTDEWALDSGNGCSSCNADHKHEWWREHSSSSWRLERNNSDLKVSQSALCEYLQKDIGCFVRDLSTCVGRVNNNVNNWSVSRNLFLHSLIDLQNSAFLAGQNNRKLSLPDELERRRSSAGRDFDRLFNTSDDPYSFEVSNEDESFLENINRWWVTNTIKNPHGDPKTHLSQLGWSDGVIGQIEYACAVLETKFGYDVQPYHEAGARLTPAEYTGIYILLKGQEIVYVGQSRNIFQRVKGHLGKDFDYFVPIKVPMQDMDVCEGSLIRFFKPKLNKSNPPGAHLPKERWEEIMEEMWLMT